MKSLHPAWVVCLLIVAFVIVGSVDSPKFDEGTKPLTWKEYQLAKFLIKHGIENPVEKAVVINRESKHPQVAAAQAVVESRVNTRAIGKRGERGAYQVREEYWGRVANRLDLQTRQHSDILEELLRNNAGDIKKSVTAYNGTGRQATGYARLVMRNIQEVGL